MDMQESFLFVTNKKPSPGVAAPGDGTDDPSPKKKRSYAMTTKYAYSIKTSRIKETDFPYAERNFSCTSDVIAFASSLQEADIEKMLILYLNAQNKLICIQIMNGTVNQCVIYPREIFRHAILSGACAVILLHNHPSGHLKPSDADIRLTNQVRDLGKQLEILVHDHLIVSDAGEYFSFREEGLI